MKIYLNFILILCLQPFITNAAKQTYSQDTVTIVNHQLFNTQIGIKQSFFLQPKLHFLVIHDNENTGVNAAVQYCQNNGGAITELVYGDKRFISFGKKNSYSFDPNQIFNKDGIAKTLKKYSFGRSSPLYIDEINKLSQEILKTYLQDSLKYIITLHNNTNKNFDIKSYLENGYLYGTADSIYVNDSMDADDFVFVTELQFYNYLKQKEINVVLQSLSGPIDGSLSVYAQQNKIPYINIEIEHGHMEENLRLIYAIDTMFKDLMNSELLLSDNSVRFPQN